MPKPSTPNSHVTLPFSLNTPEFEAAWSEWLQYRRERRLPRLLPRSIQKQLDALSDLGSEAAVAAINYSIRQGYQGIYQEKSQTVLAGRPAPRSSLGALQMQLKQVESQLEDIFYPGGCAFRVEPSPENRERAKVLLDQRLNLKRQIDELSCQQ